MTTESTPAPEPLLYFEGQPTTPAAAAQLRAELMGNKDFMKEALSGSDTAANQKMLALWQLSRGIQPPPAQTVEQVQQQTADRLERDACAADCQITYLPIVGAWTTKDSRG